MRVAVIGGGLFGCTCAIELARAGHKVEVFEKAGQLLGAASAINQFRLHEGYHYPRSDETVEECQAGLASFRKMFGGAILDGGARLYGIAKDGSKVSAQDYLAFCDRHGLTYRQRKPFSEALDMMVRVQESRIDPATLRNLVNLALIRAEVPVYLNTAATSALRDEYDQIVLAGYAASNELALDMGCAVEPWQFEVIEKPLVRVAPKWRDTSLVVMDGPFGSIDPYGQTGMHVLGHVEHCLHAVSHGLEAEVPWELEGYLNKGIVRACPHSRFDRFLEAGGVFFPPLKRAEYIGSMFTVRAVLPDMDATDARPTLVHRLDDQVLRIFSGKLGTAVVAGQSVCSILDRKDVPARSAA